MEKSIIKKSSGRTVEEIKKRTRLCKQLFPQHTNHPELGELIFMANEGELIGCTTKELSTAGKWWLWARTLFIENTMTKPMRRKMQTIALRASHLNQPIHFVSTRSPELIHAQIATQGDFTLPRSRKALHELAKFIGASANFLPTIGTVLLADVAIDNLEAILKACPDLEKITRENFTALERIAEKERLSNLRIVRMSELPHPSGKRLGDLINPDGTVNMEITFSSAAERKISIASQESLESHKRMFGWSKIQSETHNRNLAKTMALVGQVVKIMDPPAILIHNEAFISRGALNNLFNDPNNPLPVICLSSLLETKAKK